MEKILFADKSQKLFTKIQFVNVLTPKEVSYLNYKYLKLGLHIKQVVVDNLGNEVFNENSEYFDLLGKKRERKDFNSLDDFLNKYYGEDEFESLKSKNYKKMKLSEKENNKMYSKEEILNLKNVLNSIKEDCNKIQYKNCKTETSEFKSIIIKYILKFKKYISKEEYSFLYNKWKNELTKISGINIFDFNQINNLMQWKTSILKAFKSEIVLYSISNICSNKVIDDKNIIENKNEEKYNDDMEEDKDKKEESKSSDSESSEHDLEENDFNKDGALVLQLMKNANNDEENF